MEKNVNAGSLVRPLSEMKKMSGNPPGEAHAPTAAAVISEDPRGHHLAKGLQHGVQLLLIHRKRQVGDVQVCGVLLLLLLT